MSYPRHSALHGALARLKPTWSTCNGMRVPLQFQHEIAADLLGIADVSYLRKCSVKGPGAAQWLRDRGITPPEDIFDVSILTPEGGLVARVGRTEYFLEDDALPFRDAPAFEPNATAHPADRHDTGLLLTGSRIPELLAQTCGVDIVHEAPGRIVLTRLAAVNVMLLYRPDPASLRIWSDPSFGVYLWEALLEIAHDLGGGPISAAPPRVTETLL